jgi:hypothetical protein
MHQLLSTQLLSPNASYKVIKILKQQGGGKCTGACLDNTRLVFVRRRSLDDQPFVLALVQSALLQVHPSASPCDLVHPLRHLWVDLGRLLHHAINYRT